jgi:hypothetical protein
MRNNWTLMTTWKNFPKYQSKIWPTGRVKLKIRGTDMAVIANFGGTAVGDIALVPAMNLKYPRGIRDIAEWYMSIIMRPDYIHEIFSRQTDIAIRNLEKLYGVVANHIDAIFICGTDFGTQDSQFCGVDTLEEMYLPYYKKMNDWIHEHTKWKTFKHSCGAVEPFIDKFIEAGFDILNPVQVSAKGMDPVHLKTTFGDRITFWGGGVDTQQILSFGTPEDVKNHVRENLQSSAGMAVSYSIPFTTSRQMCLLKTWWPCSGRSTVSIKDSIFISI